MKFISLGDLTYKQLLQYGVIGLFLGGALNTLFKSGPIIAVLVDAVILLGWICLIWGLVKWFKEKRHKRD